MDDNSKPDGGGMSASMLLSIHMQAIADALSAVLDGFAQESVPFVLVLATDGIAQYVSNLKRQDSVELMETLLARWKAGRADIPAHYNPDLKKG